MYGVNAHSELVRIDFGECRNVISLLANSGIRLYFLMNTFQYFLIIHIIVLLFLYIVAIVPNEFYQLSTASSSGMFFSMHSFFL